MRGKEKCKALKEIRKQIAEKNDIPYAVSQCTHQGECKGTCPKCEAELRYLERELAIRQGLGKAAVIAGISVGVCAPMVACSPADMISDIINEVFYGDELEGDVQAPPTTTVTPSQPGQELTGDVQMVEPSEEDIMGKEGPNPDLIELSEEIELEVLEGDIAIDPEALNEN